MNHLIDKYFQERNIIYETQGFLLGRLTDTVNIAYDPLSETLSIINPQRGRLNHSAICIKIEKKKPMLFSNLMLEDHEEKR